MSLIKFLVLLGQFLGALGHSFFKHFVLAFDQCFLYINGLGQFFLNPYIPADYRQSHDEGFCA